MKLIYFYLITSLILINKNLIQCVNNINKERGKRGLVYRYNSATGILVAIAVPLKLPNRSVFVSYNFEANYNMPTLSTHITPGIYDRFNPDKPDARELRVNNNYETSSKTEKPSLLSRTKFYKILETNLIRSGLNGTECLLRMICENSSNPAEIANGVLGSIFHIFLSPSSSLFEEGLSKDFYEAESIGLQQRCQKFNKYCKQSVLGYLSKVF